ncbi:hypothetical protein ABZ801_36025 [Actinomadura sp. NPDC047616]|uniref:hypothetical protein n=1 Tax=Actinomadura sp. NPDC047616 TaxID=3155914 RepID=UPI0033F34D30
MHRDLASHGLGQATGLQIVRDIGDVEIWVALAVWALTFAAMLPRVVATMRRAPAP